MHLLSDQNEPWRVVCDHDCQLPGTYGTKREAEQAADGHEKANRGHDAETTGSQANIRRTAFRAAAKKAVKKPLKKKSASKKAAKKTKTARRKRS